jgi:hypothetical protein
MPFIDHDGKRVLYVHVPKTGGTSVERWLGSLATLRLHSVGVPQPLRVTPQHLRHADIEALLGEGFFEYAFMTVRNPFARLESEYRMQVALAEQGFWGKAPKFGPWLERALERMARDPHADDNHLRPQWDFLGEGVEVFRLEDGLDRALKTVAGRIGAPPPATAEHALRSEPVPIRWRKPDILRVRRAYAEDFAEFGYEDTAPEPS